MWLIPRPDPFILVQISRGAGLALANPVGGSALYSASRAAHIALNAARP